MIAYVDSSAFLARILKEPSAVDWTRFEQFVSSELVRVEVSRTIHRLRFARMVSDAVLAEGAALAADLLARFERVAIGPAVLNRAAEAFPTVIGTLDAIHLATALLWVEEREEPLVFLTHDRQLSIAARACGFEVWGV